MPQVAFLEFAFANSSDLIVRFRARPCLRQGWIMPQVAFLEFAAQTLRFKCALSRTPLPAARMDHATLWHF